jgi:hypothetical protein
MRTVIVQGIEIMPDGITKQNVEVRLTIFDGKVIEGQVISEGVVEPNTGP